MTKDQVIERFCNLATTVNSKKFNFTRAADCFCHQSDEQANFQFEEEVICFIEDAVEKELTR